MAHIGKFYPVVFRRDLNLNIDNNSNGWPRWAHGVLNFTSSGFGQVVSGKVFVCGPESYPRNDTMQWVSGLYRYGLFFYRMELIVQITDGLNFFRQVIINVQGHGDILVVNWPHAGAFDESLWFFGIGGTVEFWSPDWFDFEPPGVETEVRPLLWTEGATFP